MAWVNLFETEAWAFAYASPLFGIGSATPVVADAPASIELYADPTYGLEHHYIAPASASTGTALAFTQGSPDAGSSENFQYCISPADGVAGRLFRARVLDAGIPVFGGSGWGPGDMVIATGSSSEFGSLDFPAEFISFDVTGGNVDSEFVEFTGRTGADQIVISGMAGVDLDSFTGYVELQVWVEPVDTSYNCECDDENNNETLGELKNKMMHLLGWGATAANPPPGVAQMLTYFLQDAQAMLYRRYTQLRTERFFSWPLQAGVRMYDLPENQEVCIKKLDPRMLTWVGIERDGVWVPLISSIPPELYSYNTTGYPVRYEIRQCIEVWPTPDATLGNLIIKGHFGLEPFSLDAHKTTIDSLPVFQVALANAKAHYRQPDANNYIQQMEALIRDLTAGLHGTRTYVPGRRVTDERVYVEPRPTVPFPTS